MVNADLYWVEWVFFFIGDDSILKLYPAHLRVTDKPDFCLAKSPVAGGYAFHKCSGGGVYFDTKKRLWRGKEGGTY